MKRFSLTTVLRLRKIAEDREALKLAAIQKRELMIQHGLTVLRRELGVHEQSRLRQGRAADLLSDQRHAELLEGRAKKMREELAGVAREREVQREAVLKAAREREKVEMLQEKWEERLRLREAKLELLATEETAMHQHLRGRPA
jgi:flagellar export protein FliJ